MIGIILLAAAANAPVMLASNDEARWRRFVRASVQSPAAPAARTPRSRLMQLQGVVHRLENERGATRHAGAGGPFGL